MSEKSTSLVEMRGVKLSFADKEILRDVSFEVPNGGVLVVMGLSGCGKSTLLGILTGLLTPDEGSVRFKGEELTEMSRKKLNRARTHIGMVFQNAALISSMSVTENIALPLCELSKKSREEIDAIVIDKLKLVGLEDAGEKLPSELSGGMQKRAGLARALALDPELVLFDEPSAGLDPINSKLIDELIINLRDNVGVTSIVVTHEMESAFALATQMAFLHEGRILLQGPPEEFRESDEPTVREFLESFAQSKGSNEKR